MTFACLKVERRRSSTIVDLCRPDQRNALSPQLVNELTEVVDQTTREGVQLLVLRGQGKNFCAGFDLSDAAQCSEGDLLLRFVRIEGLLQAVFHAPFETLALIHGRNFGAGVDLAAACSRRICAPDTSFQFPGLRFGLVLGTRRLSHLIGADMAHQILSSSWQFDAAEAHKIAFVQSVVSPEHWIHEIEAVADSLMPIDTLTRSHLRKVTQIDTRALDLSDLVLSASRPGLSERIAAYQRQNRSARISPTPGNSLQLNQTDK